MSEATSQPVFHQPGWLAKASVIAAAALYFVGLYPLSPDDALRAVLQIAPADVKRIIASKPGKKKGRKR